MKKLIPATFLALTLLASACASTPSVTKAAAPQIVEEVIQKTAAQPPAAPQESGQPESNVLNADYENAVSVAMQLLLGTIQLEGTEFVVTVEQAAALTPLWTNFKSLSESMKPAQGEPGQGQANATPQPVDSGLQTQLDEVIKQIQSTMTADQIKAIAAMQITQETAQTIMTEKGITVGDSENMQGGGGQPPAGGEMPQGTPPAGGPGGGQQPGADQMGTPPADGGMRGGGMGFIPSELIDALLQLLSQKNGS